MPQANSDAQFLDEIRQVFASGDQDFGLDLIEAYLEEHPGEDEALLLKVDMCLTLGCQATFIGTTLAQYKADPAWSDQVEMLQGRTEAASALRLADGKSALGARSLAAALEYFEAAIALAPDDAAVPLAAGLALLRTKQAPPEDRESLFGRSTRGRAWSAAIPTDQIAQYLTLALERSAPSQATYETALEQLLKYWLAEEAFEKTLALLDAFERIGRPGEALRAAASAVAQSAVAKVLDIAAGLLRAKQMESVDQLLNTCAASLPEMAALYCLKAAYAYQNGHAEAALTDYQAALILADRPFVAPAATALQQLWQLAYDFKVTCTSCGKTIRVPATCCAWCDTALEQTELLTDRYAVADASPELLAQLGLAETLAALGHFPEALGHLDAALNALPEKQGVSETIKKRRSEWLARIEQQSEHFNPAQEAVEAWRRDGLTGDTLANLAAVCHKMPTTWREVPARTRLTLTRQVLEAGHLLIARAMLETALVDLNGRKSVAALRARLNGAITSQVAEALNRAQEALRVGQPEQALLDIEPVLAVQPENGAACLVRGQARLKMNQPLSALDDFRGVIATANDEALRQAAQLGAVCALEAQGDFGAALAFLENRGDVGAQKVRARLERRRRGEPVIQAQYANDMVMHDTLVRMDQMPHYQGFFAVAVRTVGRPWNRPPAEWNQRLLNAGFEFVQVLGGLRNIEGDPVFALRLISAPHAQIAERGRLTIALLVRVTAADESACRVLALSLWTVLRDRLPSVEDYVYGFEPVVDEDELASLLKPFEYATLAEIVRRETVPEQVGDLYATSGLTPGSTDLHNLCWALLRQAAPAMLSIHLLPVDLLPWELAVLDGVPSNSPAAGQDELPESSPAHEAFSLWWQGLPRLEQAQANQHVADPRRVQAYVLRVNVAGSAGAGLLLPEAVASTLFGPAHQVMDTLQGGCEVIYANAPDEFESASRNLAQIDVEGWVYSTAPSGASRLRHLVGEREAALTFRLPIPGHEGLPGLPATDVKPVAPPAALPLGGTILGESTVRISGLPLRISQAEGDRRRHTYIVGKTGVGKSTLLQNLALQDIEAGHGLCLVDPHGDLVEAVLARIPAHRMADVILFDPSDEDRPIGLNLLDARDEGEKHRVATEFIGLLVRMYDPNQLGIAGPRFQHNVRNAMLTVMAVEGSTLIEVVRALTDAQYVKDLLPHVTDPLVRNYWEKQIAHTSDFHKSEILDFIVSKFSRFIGDRLVRNIVGQRRTTLDFRQIMDQRQILLVNLSKGKIGPESAQFLGLLLVQRLLLTALSRADVPTEQRPDFFLYVDEFQNFATELFATILSEGRKYGVAATVANQYLTQLDQGTRDALFGNVGSIISFRLGTQDAVTLAPELYPIFGPDDLLNLPKYAACVKLLVDGIAARPFTMRTLPDLRPANPARARAIRQASRQKYGRDAITITEDVLARFSA